MIPRVKSFELVSDIPDALEVMMTSVRMPALTKLYLDIREINDFSVKDWLDVISLKEYPSVKDLTFVYEGYARSALDLSIFLRSFQRGKSHFKHAELETLYCNLSLGRTI
ncbi:hypothetical protein DFH11DRAFT_1546134 [Phellopilus nigrolimitatus]|nr:hypothetical protein DFH11DRAFT_1546134 [Phellopilus nigrolimitatus]